MIFFTDLDDTLLNHEKAITPKNREAIDEIRRRGHYIAITTGRALPSALNQARILDLDGENCFVIAYNGSQIYDCARKETVYRQGFEPEIVRSLFDEAYRFGIHIQTYNDTGIVAEKDTPVMHSYSSYQKLPIQVTEDFTRLLTGKAPKVLAVEPDTDKLGAFRQYMTPLVEGKADLFLSHFDLLEFVPVGVNKGAAVRFLCSHLGLSIQDSVAAGDAENDLTMIEAAHVGCAMINGDPKCKEKADYVTENDCDHDGVAEILNRFILKRA